MSAQLHNNYYCSCMSIEWGRGAPIWGGAFYLDTGKFLKTPNCENLALYSTPTRTRLYVAPPRHVDLRPFNFHLYNYYYTCGLPILPLVDSINCCVGSANKGATTTVTLCACVPRVNESTEVQIVSMFSASVAT